MLSLAILLGALLANVGAQNPATDLIGQLEAQQQALFERLAPTVVFISDGQCVGSGVFVSNEGLILTNAHVVDGVETVSVVTYDGGRFEGKVVERAKDAIDLALVKIETENAPSLPLGSIADLKVGSWIAAVGHGAKALWSFNTGMVTNIYSEEGKRSIIQTQIPINPGNSGGPMVDRLGRLVGIVSKKSTMTDMINFGIAVEVARSTLTGMGGIGDSLVINAPAGVPVFLDGRMVGTGPRVVVTPTKGVHEVFAVIKGELKKQHVEFPETQSVDLD